MAPFQSQVRVQFRFVSVHRASAGNIFARVAPAITAMTKVDFAIRSILALRNFPCRDPEDIYLVKFLPRLPCLEEAGGKIWVARVLRRRAKVARFSENGD
jgi:hypothetical protein